LFDRFGWSGEPAITLEQAGERLNISRERVRQLQERVSSRLRVIPFPVFMPGLDEALCALSEASPIAVDRASALLQEKGISAVNFHPESVIACALACGRRPPIQLQTVKKKTIVIAAEIRSADLILRTAYHHAHTSGASNIGHVVAEIMTDKETEVDESCGETCAASVFRNTVSRRRLVLPPPAKPRSRSAEKPHSQMLSVISPIKLGAIREGLRREYRYNYSRGTNTWLPLVPPRSVIGDYYKSHSEFILENGDLVKAAQPLDYRVELSRNEAILVDVLRSSPACVLDKASFATECTRRSMNINTFNAYLTYSCVIQHLGTDVWSLRGVQVILSQSKRCALQTLSDQERGGCSIMAGHPMGSFGLQPGSQQRDTQS
jgi:hypothetical protein